MTPADVSYTFKENRVLQENGTTPCPSLQWCVTITCPPQLLQWNVFRFFRTVRLVEFITTTVKTSNSTYPPPIASCFNFKGPFNVPSLPV
jgi:hypothetical protein